MKCTFSEKVLYEALLDERINQDVFHYLSQWANSDNYTKDKRGFKEYIENLLDEEIISRKEYLYIKNYLN